MDEVGYRAHDNSLIGEGLGTVTASKPAGGERNNAP